MRVPTRPVNGFSKDNVTIRKDGDKNQITTNIIYQNSLSIFLKKLITKSKWREIKAMLM